MFDAPRVYKEIPDLQIIYDFNDVQARQFDEAYQEVDDSIFLDKMGEYTIGRWEKILNIVPTTTDTVETRRFRVKTKIMERLPYTYRVIMARLRALFPNGFEFLMNEARTEVELIIDPLYSDMLPSAYEMLDLMLPLNMTLKMKAQGQDMAAPVHIGAAVVLAREFSMNGYINRPVATDAPVHYGMALTASVVKEV